MKLTSRTVQRTLVFVNRIRKEQGRKPLKRLPKGRIAHVNYCPIATALTFGYEAASVTPTIVKFPRKNTWLLGHETPPGYVRDFLRAFDNGRIPELIRR